MGGRIRISAFVIPWQSRADFEPQSMDCLRTNSIAGLISISSTSAVFLRAMSAKPNYILEPSGDVLLVLSRTQVGSLVVVTTPNESTVAPALEEIEVLVSSRHLALASKVFSIMFDGQFRERVDLDSKEIKRVPLSDDNAHAMLILLDIIHGLHRRVRRDISMPVFTAVAVLVDKYELHEVAEIYTDYWFRLHWTVESPKIKSLQSDIVDWIFLSWVFQKPAEFKDLTRNAIMTFGETFDDKGYPIPETVASKYSFNQSQHMVFLIQYL